jgi:raffinose/stachyose/melibiose transport system permease protein
LEKIRTNSGFKIGHILTYLVLILFFFITVLPLYWMWMAALIPQEIFTDPFSIPKGITFQNLVQAWTTGRMSQYMLNSIIVAVPRVTIVLLFSSLAGFAFGKLKFKGRNMFFGFILLGMMVPIQAMIIPIYYNIQKMGLINTHWAMILPALGLSMPFACFMMRAFFKEVPDEIVESATIDGCGEFKTWFFIMLPLIRPAILSLFVFEFMWSWNDFLIPMLMVYDNTKRTLPLGLMYFSGEYTSNQSLIAAGVTICTLPIIVVYTLFQKTFIEGITAGAVKG